MKTIPRLLAVGLVCAAGHATAAAAWPKEGSFDFNFCFVSDATHAALTDKVFAGGFVNRAALHSQRAGGPFDLQGARCFGYYGNVEGEYSDQGYCEIVDADGDRWTMKFVSGPDGGGTWTVPFGTGKYEGMVARGGYKPLGNVPLPTAGTARCNRNTGTYRLR
ncbi:MAG: hypothetical protein U1F52_12055 [Burkholderiales bacterium]